MEPFQTRDEPVNWFGRLEHQIGELSQCFREYTKKNNRELQ